MAVRQRIPAGEPDPGLATRGIAALVAVLFFAPLLTLLWWFANFESASYGAAGTSAAMLVGAIAAAAGLGFAAPRSTPAVFGFVAKVCHWLARLWTP